MSESKQWVHLFDFDGGPCLPQELVLSATGREFFFGQDPAKEENTKLSSSLAGWSSDAASSVPSSDIAQLEKMQRFDKNFTDEKLEYTTKRMAKLFMEGFYYVHESSVGVAA
jgi:hypothetical protein